jgi:hypothetical protein
VVDGGHVLLVDTLFTLAMNNTTTNPYFGQHRHR